MTPKNILLILVGFTVFAVPNATVFGQSPPSAFERDRARTMLDVIKADLKKYYYDSNYHGVDIDARFKEAEEKIKAATSQGQIFGIIAQALLALDDSHTYFVPPERSYTTEYGWQMQIIGDKPYIVAVKPGSDAEAKGLREGDEVFSIDGFEPTRQNIWKMNYAFQALRPKSVVHFVVVKPDGKVLEVDVLTRIRQGKRVLDLSGSDGGRDIFDLIRRAENLERLLRHRYAEFGDDLFIWKMPDFDIDEHKVDEMVEKIRKRKAVILDLRGNSGGYEETLLRMVSNFFDRDIKIGDIKRRKETKPLTSKTRGQNAFSGKLIVLIDSKSSSASELFARVVQLEKRGTVIGDVSSGAVMRSKRHNFKLGIDQVIFYGASITDADILMTDGRSLERVGVIPDERRLPTAKDLAAKHDPVLTYAASLAGVVVAPDKAGALFPIQWKP